jgi:hypothetical protein
MGDNANTATMLASGITANIAAQTLSLMSMIAVVQISHLG